MLSAVQRNRKNKLRSLLNDLKNKSVQTLQRRSKNSLNKTGDELSRYITDRETQIDFHYFNYLSNAEKARRINKAVIRTIGKQFRELQGVHDPGKVVHFSKEYGQHRETYKLITEKESLIEMLNEFDGFIMSEIQKFKQVKAMVSVDLPILTETHLENGIIQYVASRVPFTVSAELISNESDITRFKEAAFKQLDKDITIMLTSQKRINPDEATRCNYKSMAN
jgi:hypothetical protein